MSWLLLIVVLVLVVVFGAASMMQSYATAKQADAVIETAQAAQMATFGNVAVILLLVIVVLAVLFAVMYIAVRGMPTRPTRGALPRKRATSGIPTHDLTFTKSASEALTREDVERLLMVMRALDEKYADLSEEDAR